MKTAIWIVSIVLLAATAYASDIGARGQTPPDESVTEESEAATSGSGRIRCGQQADERYVLTLARAGDFSNGTMTDDGYANTCTAVRHRNGVAITGKHCVCDGARAMAPQELVIGWSRTVDTDTPRSAFGAVTKIVRANTTCTSTVDLAVLSFEETSPFPVPTSDQLDIATPVQGRAAYVYGTGDTGDTGDPADSCGAPGDDLNPSVVLKVARTFVHSLVGSSLISLKAQTDPDRAAVNGRGGFICGGDSGGPAVQILPGANGILSDYLVGISVIAQSSCTGALATSEGQSFNATRAALALPLLQNLATP